MKASGTPRGTDSARIISVIETKSLKGRGTEDNMCRIVTQYWDFEGNLLAENDLVKEKGLNNYSPEER